MSKRFIGPSKRWVIRPRTETAIINQLLVNRQVKPADWESFLNPDYERNLHDPFLMKDMDKAVMRLEQAIKKGDKIGIYADYDADGIPGAALLYEVLESLGLECFVYIPSRDEGYGLNEKGIRFLADRGVKLIITIDLGITGRRDVELAKELGMETIITDHHQIQKDKLPDQAVAVLNPNQADCPYPFKELAGAAVAFKLAVALGRKTGKFSEDRFKWLLDLVAISTFCDMVPLVGENRVLAKYGLIVLQKTRRKGLRELYKAAGIEAATISPYVVGFMIGPRINAPGRMDNIELSWQLLTCNNQDTAARLAEKLEVINQERRSELERVLREAEAKVELRQLNRRKVIMVDGDNWPDGIIGLVAGKLTERYGKPAVVIGHNGKESKGSARSIEGFHLVEVLNECQEYLSKHGGHAKAAGLTVAREHLEDLYDRLLKEADKRLTEDNLRPQLIGEAEIDLAEVDWELYQSLERLAPYGLGNPRPIFISRQVPVKSVAVVGNGGKHLKLSLLPNGVSAIGFDMGERRSECPAGGVIDIAYTIDADAWRGGQSWQLKILDLRKCKM